MDAGGRVRTIAVAAPFIRGAEDRWLTEFVTDDRFRFVKVARVGSERSWHLRGSATSGVVEWCQYGVQARRAIASGADGIVTVFPQLAAAAAAQKRLRRSDVPLLAWLFNTVLTGGWRLRSARSNLSVVDRFVVPSTREIGHYSELLALPAERFAFVPIQYGGELVGDDEDREHPFVFATGSGHRDYQTFFDAIEALGYRTLVLPGRRSLEGLRVPPSVTVVGQVPKHEIHRLVRRARVNVVPLNLGGASAGLVTIVEAFRHGRAVVGTMRPGVEDYLLPGVNSLTHAFGDADGLAESIEAVWVDEQLRTRLNAGAEAFGEEHCTDEAAGRALTRHLIDLV